MFGENENLKDIQKDSVKDTLSVSVPYKRAGVLSNSYPKLNKLITALYIVTDIIGKEEPIRLKLRTLGTEILSDINSVSRSELSEKIQMVFSFLDIALAVNLISEMNFNILKKEFTELSQSFQPQKESNQVNPIWLEEFLLKPSQTAAEKRNFSLTSPFIRSDSSSFISKKQRRTDIIGIIKDNGGNATITDIKNKVSGLSAQSASLITCSEKTLQRELVSMVKDGILSKNGEKRWSRYFLKDTGFSDQVL